MPQTLFINPVFPILPRKIPCIFPVKVTYKTSTKKNAKAKTKKLTYTLKVAKVGVALSGDSVVAVGSTTKLTNTKKNSSRAKITYTSSDDSIATVAADGTVTGVKAGKATITAKITVGKDSATTTKDVEVKNYVLKSVRQTKANEFESTIVGTTKNIKPSEITMKNTETNVVVPVKAVSVDSKDATKVTLTTFANVTDGKTYEVTLDGTTQTVVATDGKIETVNVNKATIPYATETEIKLVSKDVNGVIIDEVAYGKQDSSKYDFSLSTSNGYVNGSKLYLNKIGDTATAEVTYKTGKYDANGKPEGNITSGKLTITAVDQASVNSYDVKIAKAGKKFDKVVANKQIAVGETSANTAYFQIKDVDNNEISYYTDYTVESSDNSILMVDDASIADKEAVLTPVKAGTAYLLIKKNNTIVGSVAITVVAEKAVTTMSVDKASVALSTQLAKPGTVTASFKDQYGADIKGDADKVSVSCLSTSADKVKTDDVTANASSKYFSVAQNGNNVAVTFNVANVTKGSYVYKIAYMKDGKEVCAKTVNVNVQTPADPGKGSVSYALNVNTAKVDTLVDDNHNKAAGTNYDVTVDVTESIGGVPYATLKPADTIADGKTGADATTVESIVYKVVDKDGKAIFDDVTKVNNVTNAAIQATNGKLTVNTVSFSAISAQKNLAKGTYTVTAVITTKKGTNDPVKTTFTTSFVVEDSQPAGEVSRVKDTVAGGTIKAMAEAAFKYVYEGTSYAASDADETLTVTNVEGITNDNKKIDSKNFATETLTTKGKKVTVSKIVVEVKTGDKGYKVNIEVPVNLTITVGE
ncbi:Ig-like domain-containing protein [Roseburia faecis]|uniref:Ig-like domain-containing protein n=1 Tax=Roseburia faecis TaxID=301302 RepID=UPI003BB0E096